MIDLPLPTRVTVDQAEAKPAPATRTSKWIFNTPVLKVRWYRPPNPDPQVPCDSDEVYVVVSDIGDFVCVKVD